MGLTLPKPQRRPCLSSRRRTKTAPRRSRLSAEPHAAMRGCMSLVGDEARIIPYLPLASFSSSPSRSAASTCFAFGMIPALDESAA
jgi:hypothetical protein